MKRREIQTFYTPEILMPLVSSHHLYLNCQVQNVQREYTRWRADGTGALAPMLAVSTV